MKKLALLGGAGGIGQPLGLLLKNSLPNGWKLSLYDIAPVTPGVAKDLSHIPTAVECDGFAGEDPSEALEGADIVLITAGVARKPGMDRADLFNINAGIIKNLISKAADVCPNAIFGIITNPVNTTVSIAAEVLKAKGVYNKNKLFGVTTLDVIRSQTFVGEMKGVDPAEVGVTVIGGHSGVTILPLLSQIDGVSFNDDEIASLTHRIQNAGTEVVEAKAGGGSATLSMAQAACRFAQAVVKGMNGEEAIECAYVEGGSPHARFFAQPVKFGPEGAQEVLDYGSLSDFEKAGLDKLLETLQGDIKKGEDFVKNS